MNERTGLATAAARREYIHRGKTSVEKVRRAIQIGYDRQWEIHRATDLTVDEVSDAIAVLLLDERKVRAVALPTAHLWNSENWAYTVAA